MNTKLKQVLVVSRGITVLSAPGGWQAHRAAACCWASLPSTIFPFVGSRWKLHVAVVGLLALQKPANAADEGSAYCFIDHVDLVMGKC